MIDVEVAVVCVLVVVVFLLAKWIWQEAVLDGWSPRKWFRRGPGDQFASSLESTLDSLLDAKAAEWKTELQGFRDLDTLRSEKQRLEDEVKNLTDTLDSAKRDIERERSEIEFELGLERQRRDQEHEFATDKLAQAEARLTAEKEVAIREASVKAREEALTATSAQLRGFVDKQADLIETLTDALPKAEILAKIGNGD